MNKEEILKALCIIKNICIKNEHCTNCPFKMGKTDACYITHAVPYNWKIKTGEEDDWTAFYD